MKLDQDRAEIVSWSWSGFCGRAVLAAYARSYRLVFRKLRIGEIWQ